jgi:hypothetical protein
MDDSSIQYRIRLAQINGIKLDEAFSDEHLDVLRNTPGKTLGDKFDHLGKDKAEDLIQKIKRERTQNINAGQSSYKNLMHHDLAIGAHGAWVRIQQKQKADKLDEAKEKDWEQPKQDDSYHNMERAAAIQLYHDEMRNNTRNGLSSNRAHKEAMNAVENEHGKSGIDHLHGHFSELELNRNSEENK